MPAIQHSMTDARVCRAIKSVFIAGPETISQLTGIPPSSVEYQLDGRKNVPPDNATTERELLLWWFLQRLPTFKPKDRQAEIEQGNLIKRFRELIDEADELRHMRQRNETN